MTNIAKKLYEFWSGFGIPAYVEGTVPDDAKMPYITYRLAYPDWINPISTYARVWYRSTSFIDIAEKVDEISSAIRLGKTISFENGYLSIFKEDNFCQFLPDDSSDGMVKVAYLSLTMQVIDMTEV